MLLCESPKFGCLMLFLSATPAEEVLAFAKKHISKEDLADDGYEEEPHTTVLYGFHDDVDATEIEKITSETGPITIELGSVSRFNTHEDYDVLKIDIEGEQLRALNAKLMKAFNGKVTNNFPDFKPHMTLAYVKKGACSELDDSPEFFGREFTFSLAIFSTAEKRRYLISLE